MIQYYRIKKMMNRKLLIKLIAGLVVVIGIVLFWLWFSTATIAVAANPEATMYARQGDQDFKEIGKGQASFRTRSLDTVFVEARLQDNATQKAVAPIKRQKVRVELATEPLAETKFLARGPLIYPHIE